MRAFSALTLRPRPTGATDAARPAHRAHGRQKGAGASAICAVNSSSARETYSRKGRWWRSAVRSAPQADRGPAYAGSRPPEMESRGRWTRAVGDCLPLIAHKTKPRGSRPPGLSPSSRSPPGPRLWLCRQRSGNSSSAIASSPPHGPSALMTVRGERPGHRYFGPTTAQMYTSSVSTSVISPAAAAARTSSSDRNWCGANPALKTIRT